MFTKRIINGFLPAYGFSYNGNCWVRGYSSKTGWTETGKQNLSSLYAKITPVILALDPKQKLKISTDIDNKDVGNNLKHPVP